ncbi:MAG TPA: hypothetical protein VFN23_12220 [Ktedonobacteraceae bacterium]|nr:hypothetical protein [Ktedonobacteraceae bacterium]
MAAAYTRVKAVSLTDEGRAVAQRAFFVVEAVDEQFFLEPGEQNVTFIELMQQLIRSHANKCVLPWLCEAERPLLGMQSDLRGSASPLSYAVAR